MHSDNIYQINPLINGTYFCQNEYQIQILFRLKAAIFIILVSIKYTEVWILMATVSTANIFTQVFQGENILISIKISPNFVSKGPTDKEHWWVDYYLN